MMLVDPKRVELTQHTLSDAPLPAPRRPPKLCTVVRDGPAMTTWFMLDSVVKDFNKAVQAGEVTFASGIGTGLAPYPYLLVVATSCLISCW